MISIKPVFSNIKIRAKNLKNELAAIFLAYKKPGVPWYAKLIAIIVVGYALSPIDLIPDFIPVLGYLDDLILIPLGISLVIKLIPTIVMEECRNEAKNLFDNGKPKNHIAAFIIIIIWITIISLIIFKMCKNQLLKS